MQVCLIHPSETATTDEIKSVISQFCASTKILDNGIGSVKVEMTVQQAQDFIASHQGWEMHIPKTKGPQ